jgi:hypothetical protein
MSSNRRVQPTSGPTPEVQFMETAAGMPAAIKAWSQRQANEIWRMGNSADQIRS